MVWHCAAKAAEQLAALGAVKCMGFSSDGRLLALGGEDGSLVVLDWLTLRARLELRCSIWSSNAAHAHHIRMKDGRQSGCGVLFWQAVMSNVLHVSGALVRLG